MRREAKGASSEGASAGVDLMPKDRIAHDELWRAALSLLEYSWRQISYRYSGLTNEERERVSPEAHARLVFLIKYVRPVDGASAAQRAGQLVERAKLRAEQAVGDIGVDMSEQETDAVARALAREFVIGYGACVDDARGMARLREEGRKRGKR